MDGVKWPAEHSNEALTPAIGNNLAQTILNAPPEGAVKGKRDRAILATLLYHALRRDELCRRKVKDATSRQGIPHLRVTGKGPKIRFLALAPFAHRLIREKLDASGHGDDSNGPRFRPIKNNSTGTLNKPLSGVSVYKIEEYTVFLSMTTYSSRCT